MAEVIWTAEEVSRLIDAVKRRDSLYNPSSGEYRNRNALNQCWKEVAEIVGGGKTDLQCHDKWNILRSVYRRQRRNMVADSRAAKRTKWRWTDRMSFLHEYFTPFSTAAPPLKVFHSAGFTSPSDLRSPPTTPSADAASASPIDLDPDPAPSSAPPIHISNVTSAAGGRVSASAPPEAGSDVGGWPSGALPEGSAVHHHHHRRHGPPRALCQELREWLRVKRSAEEVDPFFLSVTRDMRKLSDKDQSMFKIQVQTLLHEFLYPSE
ncbi:uncharacterized protein LOC124169103 [Ischnura elegans]|uniref:uncharacterized protein LOC124169103 n=1 Tax=Ischnura elegans TaxID=197161 RepID=UPI001ED879C2|nr:uncharacterized protein LOC124169103 [Ischnura elegans]